MSWTHDVYIGSMRPWPSLIRVLRTDDEMQEYEPKRGTCHNAVHPNCRDYWFCCSECEFVAHTNKTVINYCPNCGARVVEVE